RWLRRWGEGARAQCNPERVDEIEQCRCNPAALISSLHRRRSASMNARISAVVTPTGSILRRANCWRTSGSRKVSFTALFNTAVTEAGVRGGALMAFQA